MNLKTAWSSNSSLFQLVNLSHSIPKVVLQPTLNSVLICTFHILITYLRMHIFILIVRVNMSNLTSLEFLFYIRE